MIRKHEEELEYIPLRDRRIRLGCKDVEKFELGIGVEEKGVRQRRLYDPRIGKMDPYTLGVHRDLENGQGVLRGNFVGDIYWIRGRFVGDDWWWGIG